MAEGSQRLRRAWGDPEVVEALEGGPGGESALAGASQVACSVLLGLGFEEVPFLAVGEISAPWEGEDTLVCFQSVRGRS